MKDYTSLLTLSQAGLIAYLRDEWSFPHSLNPHHEQLRTTIDGWASRSDNEELNKFITWNVSLFCSLCHPYGSGIVLKGICKCYYVMGTLDDILEALCSQGRFREAREIAADVQREQYPMWADAMNSLAGMLPGTKKRMSNYYYRTIDAIITLRELLVKGPISIEQYYELRSHDITVYPVIILYEYEYGLNITDGELEHPLVEAIFYHCVTAGWLQNDLISIQKDIAENNRVNLQYILAKGKLSHPEDFKVELLERYHQERDIVLRLVQEIEINDQLSANAKLMCKLATYWTAGYFEWAKLTSRYHDIHQGRHQLFHSQKD